MSGFVLNVAYMDFEEVRCICFQTFKSCLYGQVVNSGRSAVLLILENPNALRVDAAVVPWLFGPVPQPLSQKTSLRKQDTGNPSDFLLILAYMDF